MATGAEFVELGAKRLLGREDFRDRWFGFMRETVRENMEQAYRVAGVYDSALGIAADGANKIQITGTNKATDGEGHVLDIANALASTGLQFENTAAITYDVALHKTTRPDGIQINPRTGVPEYLRSLEEIGERADPGTVIDNGNGTITLVVDSVTEAGVSNAGRQVMVFLKSPNRNATTPSIAIETRSVVWTGAENRITTAGDLGQGAAISTTPADYEVILLGPTISRNTDLASTGEHCFLGEVTGNGGTPTVFNTAAQNVIDFSFSDIGDITKRDPVSGHIKIDVKSFASDVNPAITVRDTGGTPVFTVDQNGNLWVKGTTTQENVVQVNSSETITDNLTAGDASGDSHLIKGNWSHNVGASTKFYVDGATGRVGIGGFDSVGYSLYVTGKTRVSDDIEPAVDGGANLGSVGKRWGNLYVINLSFAGDFLPQTDDFQNLGSNLFRWQYGHFSKAIGIGDGNNPPLAALYIDKNTAAASGIRLDRPDSAGKSFAISHDGSSLTFTKSTSQNLTYLWQEVGDIDASSPQERGVRWSGTTLLEAAVPKTSYLNLYQRKPSVANPSEIEWVFDMSGTATTKTGFRFQTVNSGDYRFRVDANEQARIAADWFGIGDTTPSTSERVAIEHGFSSAVALLQAGLRVKTDYQIADTGNKFGLLAQTNLDHPSGSLSTVGAARFHVQNTGGNDAGAIVGIEIEIQGGPGTPSYTTVRGIDVRSPTLSGGTTSWVDGMRIQSISTPSLSANAGLRISGVTGGALNYAIYTNGGDVSLGDKLTVRANGLDVTGAGVFNTSLAVGGTGINITAGGLDVDAGGINVDAGDVNLPAYLRVGNGLYVGSKTGTTYDNDAVIEGGVTVGFSGTDPAADHVYVGDAAHNLSFDGAGASAIIRWWTDEGGDNDLIEYQRTGNHWYHYAGGASVLRVSPDHIFHYQPITGNYIRTWMKSTGETNAGVLPVTDGFRMYGDSSNWHGGGNDAFVIEKTDTQVNPDGSIVIATYGTAQIAAAIFNGNGNVRFPNGTTYFNGTNTYTYNHVINCTANFYLTYNGTDPFIYFDADDYMQYDRSANYLDTYIGATLKVRVTGPGMELLNGAGLNVNYQAAPVANYVTMNNANCAIGFDGTDPRWIVDSGDYLLYDRSSDTWEFTTGVASDGLYIDLGDTSPVIGNLSTPVRVTIGNFAANGEMNINGEGGVEIWGRAGSGVAPWIQCGPDGVADTIYISGGQDTSHYAGFGTGRMIKFTNQGWTEAYDGIDIWAGDWNDAIPNSIVYYIVAYDGDGDLVVGTIQENTAGTFFLQNSSDERYKFNIRSSEIDGLWVCKHIDPKGFNKFHADATRNPCGFIAQEVEAVFPQAVSTDDDINDNWGFRPKSVANSEIVPVLVRAVNQLRELADSQADAIATLQAQVATLEGYHP
jgi:hypothetical protein